MPVIRLTNNRVDQVSTSIGTVTAGQGSVLTVQYDEVPIPKKLYMELEELRRLNVIDYEVLEDPEVRDAVELAPYNTGLGTDFDKIGEPTDGSYADGFFSDWTPTTKIADAVDDVSELILQIVPAKADVLTGQALVLSGVTQYQARIPSGNVGGAWPTPGTLISNLIVSGSYRFDTPNPTTRFRAGKSADPTTAGILNHLVNGVTTESYDIGTFGPGTIGNMTIDSLSVYNTLWLKANAHVLVTQVVPGRQIHALAHLEAGQTTNFELVYDDLNTVPTFAGPTTAILNTKISKWLSGIEAWGYGTTIDIAYIGASGIFTKTYHPTAVGVVTCPGHATSNDNPGAVPAYNDQFSVARTITLNNAGQASLTPSLQVTLQKPAGVSASDSVALPSPINTYGIVSTTKADAFFDEVRRVILGSGTYSGDATAWTSNVPLVNGNAQQRHNGRLQYPDIVDYPGFTGDQEYQRFIAKASASTGQLTFFGLSAVAAQIARYGTGNLNALIHLSTTGKYFDLGLSVGAFNGDGSGSSRANSIGARNDSLTTGSLLAWSLGTYSTAFNNNEYRLIIIFKNNTYSLTGISEA
jgi:hypothetical protein